jgi:hypothetical protein
VPTRKQRKRRAKERRHDYEYVYVDEEGREVEVDEPVARAAQSKNGRPRPVTGRGGRKIDPPSWNKVGKRALIFAPLMFFTIRFLGKGEPLVGSVLQTLFLMLVFLPFSYFMDSFLYRTAQKRAGQPKPKP